MNERIRELADQAGFSFKYKTAPDELNPGHTRQDLKKFAELIVRECLSFCEYEGDRFDEYDSGMQERARIIRESIREHFGMDHRG